MKECILYKTFPPEAGQPLAEDNQKVQCQACAHYCQINPNKTGICGVRKNKGGKLYLSVYGRAAAMHTDPIEKKPLYHFMPGTKAFSIGTIGCNFKCGFCQNWDISQIKIKNQKSKIKNHEYGVKLSPEEAVNYCIKNHIPSIAYTYNEPTIWTEYALDIMKLARENGLKNVWVSNGYQSQECLGLISQYLDAINIDLKSFSDNFYKKICGAKLKPVLDTIKRVKELGIHQELTTLIVPGQNDSPEELKKIAGFIASVDKAIPWHISRFFPHYRMDHLAPTELATLKEAEKIGKRAGLKFVYLGNVPELTDF